MINYTDGPWFTDYALRPYVRDDGCALVVPGCLPAHGRDDAVRAIARLIAAAPELLRAVKPLAFSDPDNPPHGVALDDWRSAVAAARMAVIKATNPPEMESA